MTSRNDLAFQRDFFGAIIRELALPRALDIPLPPAVTAHRRTNGDDEFIFIENYSAQPQPIQLPAGYSDMLTGLPLVDIVLSAWDCRVIRRRLI